MAAWREGIVQVHAEDVMRARAIARKALMATPFDQRAYDLAVLQEANELRKYFNTTEECFFGRKVDPE